MFTASLEELKHHQHFGTYDGFEVYEDNTSHREEDCIKRVWYAVKDGSVLRVPIGPYNSCDVSLWFQAGRPSERVTRFPNGGAMLTHYTRSELLAIIAHEDMQDDPQTD